MLMICWLKIRIKGLHGKHMSHFCTVVLVSGSSTNELCLCTRQLHSVQVTCMQAKGASLEYTWPTSSTGFPLVLHNALPGHLQLCRNGTFLFYLMSAHNTRRGLWHRAYSGLHFQANTGQSRKSKHSVLLGIEYPLDCYGTWRRRENFHYIL